MDTGVIARKLKLLGKTVLGYSKFGVIYQDISGMSFIKDTLGEITEIHGISNYTTGDNFVLITRENDDALKIYIADQEDNVSLPFPISMITYPMIDITPYSQRYLGDTELLLLYTIDRRLFVLNYKGETANLTKHVVDDKFRRFIMDKNKNGTYSIGQEIRAAEKGKLMVNKSYFISSIDKDLNYCID